jgi:hypothetical protein
VFQRAPEAGAPCGAPALPFGWRSVQSSRPALTCIIGARRAWIVPMISSTSIPCRYTLVVDTYECPSYRWMTGNVPLPILQRQLGHRTMATTSIYLSGIGTEDVITTVAAPPAPMMSASAGLEL